MTDKPSKLKARLPRGLVDRTPSEIASTRAMLEKIRAVYELYGFDPVETPAIEYTDALGKFLPDQDRPNEGVFSFQDDDEQWLSLRYDLTAPLARYVAENFDALPKPYRSYREGWVFRNEKPGPGRYRQFMQFDADTVGSASMAADAEICMMAADTMEALGIPRGSYVVRVNNRKVLDGIIEAIGVQDTGTRLIVQRAIDKLDRLGIVGVRALLGKGRWDGGEEGKGDFTKGANLSTDQINELETFLLATADVSSNEKSLDEWTWLDCTAVETTAGRGLGITNEATIQKFRGWFSNSSLFEQGLDELEEISTIAASAGYRTRRLSIAPSVIRGLEYYTGPVYEVELLIETKDEKGRPVRFGSVGGGGRYDGLVSRFRGEPVPATGFSIGVSRLAAALALVNKSDAQPSFGPVVVTVFDQDRIADYQRMVAELRAANIRAELYLGSGKFNPQMKYSDKRNAPCVVIQGSDEKNDPAGERVVVKDLVAGAQLSKLEKGRDEYLQKQADAQRKVPRDDLVKTVQEILARHGVRTRTA
ncbi:histidine--tRNA ligase [Pseudorhodoplanes sp.]|uniref:histidine--tRNA ligase n=1 Tax=Pseudorhodoplanes sp. TaxID=1934341 RepID=UPI003D1354C5